MFEDLRNTMRFVFSQRPAYLVKREMIALYCMIAAFSIGLLRELFGFRGFYDTFAFYAFTVGVILFYPLGTMIMSAFDNTGAHPAFKRDGRFSLFIVAMFVVFWIIHVFI